MKPLTIITGGGSGIGRALAIHLAKEKGLDVLIVGRRHNKLVETAAHAPRKIRTITADVGTEAGRQSISGAVTSDDRIRFLVHNAAVLEPVKPLMEFSVEEWRRHQAINVEGPLFLTQKLLDRLKGGRVLHISSGAAHHGYVGWGAYCASKAALFSLYEILREELSENDIRVGSLRPGVVDTPMQDKVRSVKEEVFPRLQRFIKLKKEGQLFAPDQVSRFISFVLLETADDVFGSREWDYNDYLAEST